MTSQNSTAEFDVLSSKVQERVPQVITSTRLGRHQLLLNGKMFATYSVDNMSFKLKGEVLAEAFKIRNAIIWNPTNKKNPSRNWVQISSNQRKHWLKLAIDAAGFVDK